MMRFLTWRKRGNSCPMCVRGEFRLASGNTISYHRTIPGYEETEKTTSDKHQRAISKTPSDSNTGPDDYVIGPHANMHEYRQARVDRPKIINTRNYETRTPLQL